MGILDDVGNDRGREAVAVVQVRHSFHPAILADFCSLRPPTVNVTVPSPPCSARGTPAAIGLRSILAEATWNGKERALPCHQVGGQYRLAHEPVEPAGLPKRLKSGTVPTEPLRRPEGARIGSRQPPPRSAGGGGHGPPSCCISCRVAVTLGCSLPSARS
jgi:hypothetical protein